MVTDAQIGRAVREARRRRGFSQAEACRRLTLSTRALSQIESGLRPVRLTEAVAIGALFGVTLDVLASLDTTRTGDRLALQQLWDIRDFANERAESILDR